MTCKFCHSEIIEYVKWLFTQKRQVRRWECELCGPLDYRTLRPLELDRKPLESEVKGLV